MCCMFGGPKLKRKCQRYEIPSNDVCYLQFCDNCVLEMERNEKSSYLLPDS